MKLYMHYEDVAAPFTLAIDVTDKLTTVRQLKQTFVDAFNKSHADHSPLDVTTCDIVKYTGSRGLVDDTLVVDVFTQKQDLFLACRHTDQPLSDVLVIAERSSVKLSHLEHDPVVSVQTICTNLQPGTLTSEVKGQSCGRQGQSKRAVVGHCHKILDVDPQDLEALTTLVEIYFAVCRWRETLRYAESGRRHYPKEPLFRLRLAQCHMMSGDPSLAVQQLELFIARGEIDKTQKSLKFLQEAWSNLPPLLVCGLAHRLVSWEKIFNLSQSDFESIRMALSDSYMLLGKKAKAFSVVQVVLKNDQHYLPALVQYAKLTYDLGRVEALAAITIVLTAIVNDPGKKKFERALADISRHQTANEVLERSTPVSIVTNKMATSSACKCVKAHGKILEPTGDMKALGTAWVSVPALMLVATIFRDHGAIEKAELILDRALVVNPAHYAAMLMYVHILEVLDRYGEAFDKTLSFLQRNSSPKLGRLLAHLDSARGNLHLFGGCQGDWDLDGVSLSLEAPSGEHDGVLQVIALWFTLVKIIYMKGALCLLGPLLKLLDPFHSGQDLHKTFIRNEAAYYGCIRRVMRSSKSPRMPQKQDNFLYFVSDSHCLSPAWRQLTIKTSHYTIHPILSTGTKVWHLRRNGIFYPKVNFYSALQRIPDGATVVFNFGEIDCRECLQQCCDDCKYESLTEAIETLIDIYVDVLLGLMTRHHWVIYVHPVCPVLTRPVVMEFNKHLERRISNTPQLNWLDFVHDLFTSDGSCLQKIYDFDGVHLHPRYVHILEKSINKGQSSQSTTAKHK